MGARKTVIFLFQTRSTFFEQVCSKNQNNQFRLKFGTYNPGHNILELCNVLVQVRNLISNITNLAYKLPHEFPNDLRFRILGNKEILEKSQIQVETQPSVQSPCHKLNFDNSSQKTRKSRYQTFLFLSSFTGFIYFGQIFCPQSQTNSNMQNSMLMFTYSIPFSNVNTFFGQAFSFLAKIQNFQLKLKYGAQTNWKMQNSMLVLNFSVLNQKHSFWPNLVNKIKTVSLS